MSNPIAAWFDVDGDGDYPIALPKHHIACPRVHTVGVGEVGADEDIVHPIAVDIPRPAYRVAREVFGRHTRELEAVGAIEAREV